MGVEAYNQAEVLGGMGMGKKGTNVGGGGNELTEVIKRYGPEGNQDAFGAGELEV